MKKLLMAVFALAVATTVATAGVGIAWTTAWGGYTHSAPNITDGNNAILDTYGALWQLIYAGADGAIDTPNLANGANGFVSDDDVVWATRTITGAGATAPEDGTTWNNWMMRADAGGSTDYIDLTWSTAGSVYQRVYEGTSLSPETGAWYYNSPLFAFDETWTTASSPEGFNTEVNMNVAGFQANTYIPPVPEPATMGLLGLGALVMAIRRRRS